MMQKSKIPPLPAEPRKETEYKSPRRNTADPYSCVMIKSHQTTSIKRPIALVSGPIVWKITRYYATKRTGGVPMPAANVQNAFTVIRMYFARNAPFRITLTKYMNPPSIV